MHASMRAWSNRLTRFSHTTNASDKSKLLHRAIVRMPIVLRRTLRSDISVHVCQAAFNLEFESFRMIARAFDVILFVSFDFPRHFPKARNIMRLYQRRIIFFAEKTILEGSSLHRQRRTHWVYRKPSLRQRIFESCNVQSKGIVPMPCHETDQESYFFRHHTHLETPLVWTCQTFTAERKS
jgi:hypothetical protein